MLRFGTGRIPDTFQTHPRHNQLPSGQVPYQTLQGFGFVFQYQTLSRHILDTTSCRPAKGPTRLYRVSVLCLSTKHFPDTS